MQTLSSGVTGKEEDYKLKQKGRALGVLWMNLGSVEVSGVPDIFLLYLPEAAGGSAGVGPEALQSLDVGLAGVRKGAEINGDNVDKDSLFEEFVKLKEKSGQYEVVKDGVHYSASNGTMKSFTANPALPTTLPQGVYQVEVFAVRDGTIVGSAARDISAEEVGLPAWIATLAFDHGTLYGVFAVVVAVIAGLLTGVLFRGEKGAH